MLCTGRTDIREVSHAILSLLYFEDDRLKRNINSDPVQREIFRIMSSAVSIKRNEPVPDPFQNMETIRGDEDMTNKALKKSTQIM
jgi:CRISPR/Cas system CSM-associated protein Csm4 (group 5 of RAMP superfamily)